MKTYKMNKKATFLEIAEHIKKDENNRATDKFIKAYKDKFVGIIKSEKCGIRNDHDASDICMDAFDKFSKTVLKHRDFEKKTETHEKIIAYFNSICYNSAMDFHKKNGKPSSIDSDEGVEKKFNAGSVYDYVQKEIGIDLNAIKGYAQKDLLRALKATFSTKIKNEYAVLFTARDILMHSLKDILNKLQLFYTIKNTNVCKSKIYDARNAIKNEIQNFLNPSKNERK